MEDPPPKPPKAEPRPRRQPAKEDRAFRHYTQHHAAWTDLGIEQALVKKKLGALLMTLHVVLSYILRDLECTDEDAGPLIRDKVLVARISLRKLRVRIPG